MENFRKELLHWYEQNKRPLPWRKTKDPYKIWLSEVLLQQTRVQQGLPYYVKFLELFPDVFALANATEQEILKAWQGLGYYSRARNLHKTAKLIATSGGKFPQNHKELLKLPGIGEYTSAAILSISFNLPFAVLDGNVYRVLARLFLIAEPVNSSSAKKIFNEKAAQLLDNKQPGEFNQAMMELGAMVCTPQNPSCIICPVQHICMAFKANNTDAYPVKLPKKQQKQRYFHYLVVKQNEEIFFKKRTGKDIWQNMYELPMVEKESTEELSPSDIKNMIGAEVKVKAGKTYKHILSHQVIHAKVYEVEAGYGVPAKNFTPANPEKIKKLPLPRLIEKILDKYL
jgi:A/G-specific adenine glycosylase